MNNTVTREQVYEFIARQKMSLISSEDKDGYPQLSHTKTQTLKL